MAGLTLARRSTILGAVLLAIIMLLFIGRVVGFPVAVIIVSGRSMEPTLEVGDIVVGVKSAYSVGDIVIWCASPTYCVVHRVIEISNRTVVTKGDNNPSPDPPIPRSLVKYRVVTVIRRWEWLPFVGAGLLIYAYVNRDYFRKKNVRPGDIASLVLVSFIVFNATVALLAPTYYSIRSGGLAVPHVALKGTSILRDGSILITLNVYNTKLIKVTSCSVWIYGEKRRFRCDASVESPTQIIVKDIPLNLLVETLREGKGPLLVSVEANILFGRLRGTYYIYPSWKEPAIKVLNGTVTITNPNPIPLTVNVTTYTANKPGPTNTTFKKITLPPWGSVKLDLSHYKYAYVQVRYVFRGKVINKQLRVRP